MSEYETILIEQQEQVLTITLNRPQLHNSMNTQMILELTHVFIQAQQQDEVRLIKILGAGKSFCAGADLNDMKRMIEYSEQENIADAKQLAKLLSVIDQSSKPTVAQVHGNVFGGGLGILCCCDIVVAQSKSCFCFSEVRLGLIPAVISPYVLAKIGSSHARHLFISAERFDSQKAQAIGLVHEVAAAEQFESKVQQICQSLKNNGPRAMNAAKKIINDISVLHIDETIQNETAKAIAMIRVSAEGQEGLQAFLARRKPNW